MEKHLKALSYQQKSVGKIIKSSKKLHIWTISLKTQIFSIQLYLSKFSGKKTLKVNEEIRFSGKTLLPEFIILNENITLSFYPKGKHFNLLINGKKFESLKKETENPIISIQDFSSWEKIAKPFSAPSKIRGIREKFPLKKKVLIGKMSFNNLTVPVSKPRSSSHKTETLKFDMIDLLS
jgi:hypothetical protein